MKLKHQFIVRNVGGQLVAVAVGQTQFYGMIQLNASGEFIFRLLQEENPSMDQLLDRFAARFGITKEAAQPSVERFLDHLRENDLLEEDGV